ncbi:hypothetical protein BIW11_12876, partial [Tropilaelaps mercedesae]
MMLPSSIVVCFLVWIVTPEGRHQFANAATGEFFTEELLIKPLPSGHVYAQFCFSTS